MEFMNGVVLIKEIVTLSIVGSLAFFCAELIAIALAYGGVILHIKGRSYCYFSAMNEFQERYEIISYENGVYTIKVKGS